LLAVLIGFCAALSAQPRSADSMKLSMGVCPCETRALCASPAVKRQREVVAVAHSDEWKGYDLRALTTISIGHYDADLLCEAHTQGVRVLLRADADDGDVLDDQSMALWQEVQLHAVTHKFVDGVHVTLADSCVTNSSCLMRVAAMMRGLKSRDSGVMTAVTVPWSPMGVDGRIHNVAAVAKEADIVIVAATDMRRAVYDRCIASSHTSSALIVVGVGQYMDLGVSPSAIVLGLPWYGLDYPCANNVSANADSLQLCALTPVPAWRAPCSDANAFRVDLSEAIRSNLTGVANGVWDPVTETWYATYQRLDGSVRQVWYDDTSSLTRKFQIARRMALAGIAVLNMPKNTPELQSNILKSVGM